MLTDSILEHKLRGTCALLEGAAAVSAAWISAGAFGVTRKGKDGTLH
jgi:hypothetical protein